MDKARPTFKLSAASLSQEKLGNSASSANPRFLLSSGQPFSQPKPEPSASTSKKPSVPKEEEQDSPGARSPSRPQKASASQSRSASAAASKSKRPTSVKSSSSSRSPETPASEPRAGTSKSKRPTSSQSPRSAESSQKASTSSRSTPQNATFTQSRLMHDDSDSEDSDDLPIGNMGIGDHANSGSGINNNDDEDSDATSIDSETFKESYQHLTMDAKKMLKQLQFEKLQKSKEIMENVLEGQGLAVHMGCSSSKAITAWDHTAAIAETVAVQARQCGTVCNIFSADKYMSILMASCTDKYGRYDSDLLSQKMFQHYVGCSRLGTSGMTTLLGLVDFTEEDAPDEPPEAHKPRRRIQFSQKLTQHEVINSQAKQKDTKYNKKEVEASRRKAKAIRSACKQRGQESVPLVAFAMSGAETPGDFLQNVFEVSVATRDGYASLENPVDPDGLRSENNNQLEIQGTEPPMSYTEGTLDVVTRNQRIVSFSAKQMREMLCKKKVEVN